MASLEKRIAELESKMGSGKAWLVEHNGFRTIMSDAKLRRLDPGWRQGAVPWPGRAPYDGVEGLAESLRFWRLWHKANGTLSATPGDANGGPFQPLSESEKAVLALLADPTRSKLSNEDIAREAGADSATVAGWRRASALNQRELRGGNGKS